MNITRPAWTDEMTKELALVLAPQILEWHNDSTITLEDVTDDCLRVFRYSWSYKNGYELAKGFEDDCGYSPDPQLVDILDTIHSDQYKILEKHVKEWVKLEGLKLEHETGTSVIVKDKRAAVEVVGEIVKHYPDTFRYGIWWEGLGYTKGNGHRLINAEEIKLNTEQKAQASVATDA